MIGIEDSRTKTDEKPARGTPIDAGIKTMTVGTDTMPVRDSPLCTIDGDGVFMEKEYEPRAARVGHQHRSDQPAVRLHGDSEPGPAARGQPRRRTRLRSRQARVEYPLAAFEARHRNLIVPRAPLPCPSDPRCVPGATGTFESQNVDRARVRGVEASALHRFAGPWAAQAAYAKTRGGDSGRNRPLNSVERARRVAGLFYDTPRFNAAAHVTYVEAKDRIDTSAGALFATPSFTILDMNASVPLTRTLRLSLAALNVTDRKYWLWSDVKGVLNPGASVDRCTQPGRHFNLLVRAQF